MRNTPRDDEVDDEAFMAHEKQSAQAARMRRIERWAVDPL